ncbi:cyclase family protein [Rhizobium laguerreae]|jgi:kynurenine formamidase|uniref:cyclase family protein n=1 Tax=Rhizobium laguerreae TaxID=1076926 RepID=UPI001C91EE06|nr:cyclase family protein [Rhizobium laguerreae]MBY3307705.1 cyclase family protein [Rhizobium laguerreae]
MKVDLAAIQTASRELSNWGRWGDDDQIGTLNNISPEAIVDAARLVRKGKVFALGLSLKEPIQSGLFGGRWNPIHTMLATGTDAVLGNQDEPAPYLRYADDAINMPCQASTQWDALCHIFMGDKMYNGFDASLVDVRGAKKNGIEHVRDKMVGRGVLLDVARYKQVESLEDGYAISREDLDGCAASQGVEIRKGDFVIVRTGHQERCLAKGDWTGYAGGSAPGFGFETCYWLKEKDVAAICSDTWGCEVRPNETNEANQPWHWVVIPAIGISMGEIFYLKELAQDCAEDKVYEFFFSAPPLHLPGGAGSPINPQAIK